MIAPVVDAEDLGEFLRRARAALPEQALRSVSERLAVRRRWTLERAGSLQPMELFALTPATRRLQGEQQAIWSRRLTPILSAIVAGDAETAIGTAGRFADRPAWLLDWMTFWLHQVDPSLPWWARWVYAPGANTGALPLVLLEPQPAPAGDLVQGYRLLAGAWRFLADVVGAVQELREVEEVERPLVALALVYLTYLYTLASWRLTEEFTQVLGPPEQVLDGLLGLRRWEVMQGVQQG